MFRCTPDGSSFFTTPPCLFQKRCSEAKEQTSKRGRVMALYWNDYNSCFLIIIVTFFLFLCVCGCILRSLCCAIITDECMLGPIKKYPNGNIFWKGCDHQNPKKVLHPSVCLFSLIICTVKVCSSNRHYLFSYFIFSYQLTVGTPSSAPFFFFFFFLSGERVLVWNVVTRENCSLRHLPT